MNAPDERGHLPCFIIIESRTRGTTSTYHYPEEPSCKFGASPGLSVVATAAPAFERLGGNPRVGLKTCGAHYEEESIYGHVGRRCAADRRRT